MDCKRQHSEEMLM